MLRRFFIGFIAMIILLASIPVFALGPDPTVPGYILERRKLNACNADTNKWLTGYIETAPAIVTDAINRLSIDLPGAVPDLAIITAASGGYTDVKLLYVPAATSYTHANLGINQSNSTWPYLRGYGNSLTEYNVYKYSTYQYSGTYDDPVFYRRKDFDGNQSSTFFMTGTVYIRYSAPWAVNWSGTVPDDTCTGQVSVTPGYIAFDAPVTIDPGYSGPALITLQPGNLLIFEKSGGFAGLDDISILADNLPRSPLVGPWTTRNTIKSFPSLPDPSSVFVLPYLEWTPVPGTTDWLGRSSVGNATWQISQYTDDYAVYLNPIFGTDVSEGGLFGGNQADYNPANKLFIKDVADFDRIMLVPVVNRFGQSYIDYDSGSVLYEVSFTNDGTPEYTPEGSDTSSADANKPGGATSIDDPYVDTVGGILGILERGAEAIKSLTSGSQNFFSAIRDMFTWLPQEIQTILVSALALVFAIGVIKILH